MKKTAILFLPALFLFANQANAQIFDDVEESNYNADAIQYLKSEAIVEGYPDGSYKPSNRINRAEFTKIIIEATYPDEEINACDSASFPDVPAGEWFSKYVCMAKKHGVVSGYPDGTFKPAGYINFAEASKIVAESQNVPVDTTGTNNEWFAGYVKGLENKHAIPGTVQFFEKQITRGEMSEIVYRLKDNHTDKVTATYKELTEPFPNITSCPALLDKFREYEGRYDYSYSRVLSEDGFLEGGESEGPSDSSVTAPATAKAESAEDFSQTNVQVEGVDEADIVKNDGEFIYLAKGGDSVRIIKAFPPSVMSEVAKIDFTDTTFYPSELYVTENELVVIGSSINYYYSEEPLIQTDELSILPPYNDNDQTQIYIYDIADRSAPKLLRKVTYDGFFRSSRRIANQLYLVLSVHPNVWAYGRVKTGENLLPTFIDGDGSPEPLVGCGDIRYFPGYRIPQYLITTSLQIDDPTAEIHRNVFLGSSENTYSSRTHLYVASTVVDYDRYTDWDWSRDKAKTHVFRFALEDGEINFIARGEVPGRILNQFSMDAYINHFRIATTTGNQWSDFDPSRNNVYVLDGNMKMVGKLEDLAKGERIYSTRFLGDRLYMVTFERIDPLFVIDLSSPTSPRVLGQLKIPGFSEYLHPYDANHIIGFGQETTENEWGGTVTDGFKMSLFDVSDVNNPQQKFVEVIGDRGTYSELLSNHKALLFDKEKELLAFPITIQEEVDYEELKCGLYTYSDCPGLCEARCIPTECYKDAEGVSVCTDDCDGLGSCIEPSYKRLETTFSGALVYSLNLQDGFVERGRVSHYTEADYSNVLDYFPYDYQKNVQRILQIGEFLYTVAQGGVKVSTLADVQELKFVGLED